MALAAEVAVMAAAMPATAAPQAATMPGAAVIAELMPNPRALDDRVGEYVEIFNPATDTVLTLAGCELITGIQKRFTLPHAAQLQPRGRLLLAASRSAVPQAEVIVWRGVSLPNRSGRVALWCDMVLVDAVVYGPGWPLRPGIALNLNPLRHEARANDRHDSWCTARTPLASGDKGTPGLDNDPCYASPR